MKLLPALAALFAAFMGLFTPDKPQIKEPPQMAQIVRTTENDYDKMWKKIESLEQKGMTKDALKLAEEILAKAKSENNDNQQVKSILHIMKYKNVVQENSDSLQMLFINEQIAAAKFPVKNILRSFKASMFEQYYNAHRWEIIGRTKVEGQVGNELDFKTYDPNRFMEAVQNNYLASLENASELQKEPVGNYLEILVHDKNSESAKYQPTLYDILANRALDFFKSTEYDITRPADAFSLSVTQGFAPAKEFVSFQFSEKDNLSRDLRTAQIYQNLLSYHLKSGNTGALIMADLSRLTWAKDRVVITDGKNRNTAYIETLETLAKQYDSNEDAAEIYAIIASSYQQNNNKIKAMQICEATIQKYPNARGTKLCKDIKNQLLAKNLDMEVEDMNVPNKPIRARLAYQNLSKVYFRLIAKTKTLDDKIANKYNQERAKILAGEPALKTWEQTLPEAKDYLNHSTEVKIPEMQIGDYYLLCSDNSSFSVNHAALNYVDYHVHSVAHYQLRAQEGRYIFFTDRQSGEALSNLTVTEFQYDYNKQKEVTLGTFTTDKLGRILLTDTKDNSYRNTVFEIQRGTEKYRTQYIYRYPEYAERVETNYELHIFTDRKIYRPGQTVYFKAIFLSKTGEQVQLEKNKGLNTDISESVSQTNQVALLECI